VRRIQRDTCHEDFIKSLTSGEQAVFRDIWRLLLFAGALGSREGRGQPLESIDSGKAIPENYFSAAGWRGFLYLIGVADTRDSECLRGTEEAQNDLIKAFEEYANHGLHVLSERMNSATSPFDELISILLESRTAQTATPDVDDLI